MAISDSLRNPQSAAPLFLVHSIRYAMPGNATKLTYTQGDSHGSSWTLLNSQSNVLNVGWKQSPTSFTGFDSAYKLEHTTTTKLSIQKTSLVTEVYSNFDDSPDHGDDVFTLWINPTITKNQACGLGLMTDAVHQNPYYEFGWTYVPWQNPVCVDAPCFWDFTVSELLHPETVTDALRSMFLAQLTHDDVLNGILVLDPFVNPVDGTFIPFPALVHTDRFRPAQGLCGDAYTGLPQAISKGHSYDCKATYSDTLDTMESWNHEWSASAKLVIPNTNWTISDGLTIKYNRTFTESTGHNNSSEIFLGTTTPNFCIAPSVAIDTMYNVYVVESYNYSCAQP